MRLVGLPPAEILARCQALRPEVDDALACARAAVPVCKREVWPHQAAALYVLAVRQASPRTGCLEIGTALGYSAAVLAQAFAAGWVVTLNPKVTEYPRAVGYLAPFGNVTVLPEWSADYLAQYAGPKLAMIFVDGSHRLGDVRIDCGWLAHLEVGGLLLFHDYSPANSPRPNAEAMQAVDELGARLGRAPDVLIVDSDRVGMAGFYRRIGEGE